MQKIKDTEIVEAEVETKAKVKKTQTNNSLFWGLLLILLGGLFFMQNYFEIDVWNLFWPLILVFIGLFLIAKGAQK